MSGSAKVLVSAYACEPGKGSEPGIGWNTVQQIARFHETWVLTRAGNRASIENSASGSTGGNSQIHWVYVAPSRWTAFLKKLPLGPHLYYCVWQAKAYQVARRLHRQVGFDLVHHVTYGNYWLPIYMAFLGIPLVWGPVGGGEDTPRPLYACLSRRGRALEYLRNTARWLSMFNPVVRRTARLSRVALVTSPQTAEKVRRLGARNVMVCSQVALPDGDLELLRALPAAPPEPIRFVSIGRLLAWKGFELGLRAFACLADTCDNRRFEYWIIGSGPEHARLEQVAAALGVSSAVRFWGALTRPETLEKLSHCHVLVHPSLHESGGYVCAEAMAAGKPVICLDLGGPSLLVAQDAGFRIPAKNPSQAIQDLKEAMSKLAAAPELRARMGRAGREWVQRTLTWERKGEWLARLYEDVVRNDCREH